VAKFRNGGVPQNLIELSGVALQMIGARIAGMFLLSIQVLALEHA